MHRPCHFLSFEYFQYSYLQDLFNGFRLFVFRTCLCLIEICLLLPHGILITRVNVCDSSTESPAILSEKSFNSR